MMIGVQIVRILLTLNSFANSLFLTASFRRQKIVELLKNDDSDSFVF